MRQGCVFVAVSGAAMISFSVNLRLLFSRYGFRAAVSMVCRVPWVIAISNSTSGLEALSLATGSPQERISSVVEM